LVGLQRAGWADRVRERVARLDRAKGLPWRKGPLAVNLDSPAPCAHRDQSTGLVDRQDAPRNLACGRRSLLNKVSWLAKEESKSRRIVLLADSTFLLVAARSADAPNFVLCSGMRNGRVRIGGRPAAH